MFAFDQVIIPLWTVTSTHNKRRMKKKMNLFYYKAVYFKIKWIKSFINKHNTMVLKIMNYELGIGYWKMEHGWHGFRLMFTSHFKYFRHFKYLTLLSFSFYLFSPSHPSYPQDLSGHHPHATGDLTGRSTFPPSHPPTPPTLRPSNPPTLQPSYPFIFFLLSFVLK